MNSLRQLIDQGIAPMRAGMWGKEVPGANCPCNSGDQNVAMMYNNIYGTITNTHAEAVSEGVLITGSLISNPREWVKFMERKMYLGVEFEHTFIEWAEIMGYDLPMTTSVNGQISCILVPKRIEKENEDED